MATQRALSPSGLLAFSSSPHARLSVPTMKRPTSPLSPRSEGIFRPFESQGSPRPSVVRSLSTQQASLRQPTVSEPQLQQQEQEPRQPEGQQQQQKQPRRVSPSLQLPALPRFHPANFPSACRDAGPVSPGLQQRVRIEAQRKIYQYQQETLRGWSVRGSGRDPESVHLSPLGSPGLPMTPLTLDEPIDGFLGIKASPSPP